MKAILTIVGVWVIVIVGLTAWGASYYYGAPYQVDQANGFVDLAAASNNLNEVISDLNQTLVLLAPFHGNPNPLFPTAHTNFDLIKKQIVATVSDALIVANQTPDSFSYQQALKNIQSDLTTTIETELSDTAGTMMWWGFGMWGVIIFLVWAVVEIPVYLVVSDWEDKQREKKRQAEQAAEDAERRAKWDAEFKSKYG